LKQLPLRSIALPRPIPTGVDIPGIRRPAKLATEPENQLIVAEGDFVIAHGRFSGNGRPAAWIAADIVHIEDGKLTGSNVPGNQGIGHGNTVHRLRRCHGR
jgi:hypothetical protein